MYHIVSRKSHEIRIRPSSVFRKNGKRYDVSYVTDSEPARLKRTTKNNHGQKLSFCPRYRGNDKIKPKNPGQLKRKRKKKLKPYLTVSLFIKAFAQRPGSRFIYSEPNYSSQRDKRAFYLDYLRDNELMMTNRAEPNIKLFDIKIDLYRKGIVINVTSDNARVTRQCLEKQT